MQKLEAGKSQDPAILNLFHMDLGIQSASNQHERLYIGPRVGVWAHWKQVEAVLAQVSMGYMD